MQPILPLLLLGVCALIGAQEPSGGGISSVCKVYPILESDALVRGYETYTQGPNVLCINTQADDQFPVPLVGVDDAYRDWLIAVGQKLSFKTQTKGTTTCLTNMSGVTDCNATVKQVMEGAPAA